MIHLISSDHQNTLYNNAPQSHMWYTTPRSTVEITQIDLK
jgi:hypothetical protein